MLVCGRVLKICWVTENTIAEVLQRLNKCVPLKTYRIKQQVDNQSEDEYDEF